MNYIVSINSGGGILITTQGEAYQSKLTAIERELFDSNQLVTRKYLNEGNRLYSSFQPFEFMKKLIAGKFEVIDYISGEIKNNEPTQDSWLLRKI